MPLKHLMTGALALVFSLSALNTSTCQYIGPEPYLEFSDSPFMTLDSSAGYFYLEDFEDGLLNTPGVTDTIGSGPLGPFGRFRDSVDGDDGVIDGFGRQGWSYFSGTSSMSIEFAFDAGVLGTLPTHVGLVWTDAGFSFDDVSFEAFDAAGVSLGLSGPFSMGDGFNTGETAEDRFFGVIHSGGVSKIAMSQATNPNWEVDHLQYGVLAAGSGDPLLAPSPYAGFPDSPYALTDFSSGYFHLEDFEDGLLDTPGVTASGSSLGPIGPSPFRDSVDADDGLLDGLGQQGWSYAMDTVDLQVDFTFDASVLGLLPTHVGLVWTDAGFSYDRVVFEAYDEVGTSLGVFGPKTVGDGSNTGETGEDRFFGLIHEGGVSKVSMRQTTTGNWEVDHLQYGAVISPWTDLGGGTTGIAGQPTLVGSGELLGGSQASLTLTNAPAGAAMLAWISFAPVPFAALGGTVHAFPFASQLLLFANAGGGFSASTTWPAGIPSGTEVSFQFLVEDLSSIHGITLSNGLRATTP